MNRIASMAISIIIFVASSGGVIAADYRLTQGRSVCGSLGAFRAKLKHDWGEVPYAAGIHVEGQMLQIFVNPQTRSWTILITTAGKMSCVTAHGTDWMHIPPAVPERKTEK